MLITFAIFSILALILTIVALTRTRPVHGLVFLVLSFFCLAVTFYTLGAPFAAALEVIIYAGAIMTLFLFVIMMLDGRLKKRAMEKKAIAVLVISSSLCLCVLLFLELLFPLRGENAFFNGHIIGPQDVGKTLLGPYLTGVELASLMLLAGLIGAFHLARKPQMKVSRRSDESRWVEQGCQQQITEK